MEYIKIISIKTLQPNTITNLPFPVANNAVIESADTIMGTSTEQE